MNPFFIWWFKPITKYHFVNWSYWSWRGWFSLVICFSDLKCCLLQHVVEQLQPIEWSEFIHIPNKRSLYALLEFLHAATVRKLKCLHMHVLTHTHTYNSFMMYMDADSDGDIPLLTCSHCSSGCLCTDFLPPLQGSSLGRMLCMVLEKIASMNQIVSTKHSATLICLILIFILVMWDKCDAFCTEQDHQSKAQFKM